MNGVSAEKILAAMSDGLAKDARFILCYRIYGEYYLFLNDKASKNLYIEYDEAIEHASMALDLSTDIEQLRFNRLSTHLTPGLAHYFSRHINESFKMFKVALEESAKNLDVVVLLAQVLWAKGGEEEKEVAREQLFACIENHLDHLPSMLLLGCIGVLDDNEDILEAVMGELYSICGRKLDMGFKDEVDNLLTVVSQFRKNDPIPIAASGDPPPSTSRSMDEPCQNREQPIRLRYGEEGCCPRTVKLLQMH
ncbi:hypothetical protein BDZ91DRAFT_758562 [Kalaharituber pfeilii]|nr:hypothetical protein BDZ91DRAFT_758562 [Kalaharituber pfeilii]